MADQNTAPVPGTDGQAAAPADTTATSTAAPTAKDGQGAETGSSDAGQAAAAAPAPQLFEENFDPKTLPPELQVGYKQMHSAFTKRMQGISQDRDLLDQAKKFMADPITGMQQMAQQYGYRLTRAEAAAAVAAGQGQPSQWDPASGQDPPDWNTLLSTAESRAEQRIMQKFGPIIENVQKLQATSIEKQLDDLDPQWRTHEDAMKTNMQNHPTLVKDVNLLYRMSVPPEVLEARATQAALARLQKNTNSARVSGTSTARATSPAPREVKTFADAVEAAKEQLGKR